MKYNKLLYSVKEYAELCDTTPQAISMRINRGRIKPIPHYQPNGDIKYYIDPVMYPPGKLQVGRPKKLKKN